MAIRFLIAGRSGGDPKTPEYWAYVDHIRVVTPLDNVMCEVILEAHIRGVKISAEKPDIEKQIQELLRSAA